MQHLVDDRRFLEGLVRRESLSGAEGEVAKYLLEQMARRGFRVGQDAAGNAWGEVGPEGAPRQVLLLGHMDTVPGAIPVRWEGDVLHGRGAVDAKGPLASFVLAAAQAAPRLQRTRVRVVGAVEEERESRGAHYLVRHLPPPDFCIVGEPSSWEGVTLGYKGVLRVEYRRSQPAHHTAHETESAAEAAVAFWNRLAEAAASWSEGKSAFRALSATLRAVNTGEDGLSEWARLTVSLRLPPEADPEEWKDRILSWADGAEVSFPYEEPPVEVPKNSPLVRSLVRAIRAVGGRPRFKLKTGTSDMNVVGAAWGCPVVAYGPGDSSLDHTPWEHISWREFRRSVEVLTHALLALDGASGE
ncbi:MAG: [LysW]-lysine hydrolase [Anaerolineae bacterium]|nr:[LysW]-lysine hydrolase [Anaerolineae bacterium]